MSACTMSEDGDFSDACQTVFKMSSLCPLTTHLRRMTPNPVERMQAREAYGMGGGWILTDGLSSIDDLIRCVVSLVSTEDTPSVPSVTRHQLQHRYSSVELSHLCLCCEAVQASYTTFFQAVCAHMSTVIQRLLLQAGDTRRANTREILIGMALHALHLSTEDMYNPLPTDGSRHSRSYEPVTLHPSTEFGSIMLHLSTTNRRAVRLLLERYIHKGGLPHDVVDTILANVSMSPMHCMHQVVDLMAKRNHMPSCFASFVRQNLSCCMGIAMEAHLYNGLLPSDFLRTRMAQLKDSARRVTTIERSALRSKCKCPQESSEIMLNTLIVCDTYTSRMLRSGEYREMIRSLGLSIRHMSDHADLSTSLHHDIICANRFSLWSLQRYQFKRVILWCTPEALYGLTLPRSQIRWMIVENATLPWMQYPMSAAQSHFLGFQRNVPNLLQLPSCVFVV